MSDDGYWRSGKGVPMLVHLQWRPIVVVWTTQRLDIAMVMPFGSMLLLSTVTIWDATRAELHGGSLVHRNKIRA